MARRRRKQEPYRYPGKPALLSADYQRMTRSPFARWMTLTDGKQTVDVLVYEVESGLGDYYCGYEWPLHDGVYKREDDGLPCWGDAHNIRHWQKSEWHESET